MQTEVYDVSAGTVASSSVLRRRLRRSRGSFPLLRPRFQCQHQLLGYAGGMDGGFVHLLFVRCNTSLESGAILSRNLVQAFVRSLLLRGRAACLGLLAQASQCDPEVGANEDLGEDVAPGPVSMRVR